MKPTMKILVFCFLISLRSCQKPASDKGETTCSAPAVKKDGAGTVTCHFPYDASSIRPVTLTVERYPLDSNSPVSVLDCSWVGEGTQPCQVHEGYTFDGNVDTTLSLKIADASDVHVGRYACKMMSSSIQPAPKTCTFQLKEDDPLVDSSTTGGTPSSQKTTESFNTTSKATNSSHPSTARQEEGSKVVIVAVVVPVAVVIIALAVVATVVCYRKKKLCFEKKASETEESPERREEQVPLKGPPATDTVTAEVETKEDKDKEDTDTDQSKPADSRVKEDADSDDDDDKKSDDSDHPHEPPDNKP